MEFGPVQIVVIGFEGDRLTGKILPELRRLRDADTIRLIDLVFVTKDEDGEVAMLETTDLKPEESAELGALAGALVGLGALGAEGAAVGAQIGAERGAGVVLDDDTWAVADVIPPGTSAAVALIEHRWAIPLRDAIADAGGFALADTWIHPQDLVAVGAELAAGAGG